MRATTHRHQANHRGSFWLRGIIPQDWTKRVYAPGARLLYHEYYAEPRPRTARTPTPLRHASDRGVPQPTTRSSPPCRSTMHGRLLLRARRSPTTVSRTRSTPTWATANTRTPTRLESRSSEFALLFPFHLSLRWCGCGHRNWSRREVGLCPHPISFRRGPQPAALLVLSLRGYHDSHLTHVREYASARHSIPSQWAGVT